MSLLLVLYSINVKYILFYDSRIHFTFLTLINYKFYLHFVKHKILFLQERATLLYLRYASRWGRAVVRGYLTSPPVTGGRHCPTLQCPCQFIDEHLKCKPTGKLTLKGFFTIPDQPRTPNCHIQ